MAIIDGAALGTLGGLRTHAYGVVGDQVTVPYAPANYSRYPLLVLHLQAILSTTGSGNSDVQWEVASDAGFATVVWTQTTLNHADGIVQVTTGPLTDGTLYWWRTRSAATGTTGWGAWSAVWQVTPDINTGRGYAYVDINVGIQPILDADVAEYVNLNAGVQITLDADAVEYVNINTGVEITRKSDGLEYGYVGDVNTDTPNPHIWFLRPNYGREGDGVSIVGFGFGDLVSTFSGVVEVDWGGVTGWQSVPVVSWQTFPPTVDAYGPDRTLNEFTNEIDMQHTTIEIVVPPGAIPPGYPVRVRTEGP